MSDIKLYEVNVDVGFSIEVEAFNEDGAEKKALNMLQERGIHDIHYSACIQNVNYITEVTN